MKTGGLSKFKLIIAKSCLDLVPFMDRLINPNSNKGRFARNMAAMDENKLIIAGSAGLLGEALAHKFCGHFKLIGIYNNNPPSVDCKGLTKYQADLADAGQVKNALAKLNPDIIINSAAWVDVDGCESDRERALKSNYKVVENLVNFSQRQNIYLIQISTDYIFNGKDHAGRINDKPDPLNYYLTGQPTRQFQIPVR